MRLKQLGLRPRRSGGSFHYGLIPAHILKVSLAVDFFIIEYTDVVEANLDIAGIGVCSALSCA